MDVHVLSVLVIGIDCWFFFFVFVFLTKYDDLEIIVMLKITSLCFFLAVFDFRMESFKSNSVFLGMVLLLKKML